MAITVTLKAHDGQASAGATTFTGSTLWTPTNNTLQLVFVTVRAGAGISADPALTGHGGTYTLISRHQVISDATKTLMVFRQMFVGASNGALTLTRAGADTWDSMIFDALEVGGVDTTGTAGSGAVLQTVYAEADTGGSSTLTVNITMTTGTALLSGACQYSVETASTPRASWTQDTDDHVGGTNLSFTSQHFIGTDTAASNTWAVATGRKAIFCCEILAAGAVGVTNAPTWPTYGIPMVVGPTGRFAATPRWGDTANPVPQTVVNLAANPTPPFPMQPFTMGRGPGKLPWTVRSVIAGPAASTSVVVPRLPAAPVAGPGTWVRIGKSFVRWGG